jgi:hypothetical protein
MPRSTPLIGPPARHDGPKLAALALGVLAFAGLLLALAGEPSAFGRSDRGAAGAASAREGWSGLPDLELDLDADELGTAPTVAGILATGAVVRWGCTTLLLLTLPVTFYGIVLSAQVA